MILSHGTGSRKLHIIGNFYRHEPQDGAVPPVRIKATNEFLRHINSQSRFYAVGALNGPDSPVTITNGSASTVHKLATFEKGSFVYSTVAMALEDARDALANARTPGHRARAQLRVDELEKLSDMANAPVALYYLGHNGHLYSTQSVTSPGTLLAGDERKTLLEKVLTDAPRITVKGVDATELIWRQFLDRGLVDVDAFVDAVYGAADVNVAGENADKMLDSASLFTFIRGCEEESLTLDEYVEGYVTDASLLAIRVKDGRFGHIVVSNYERTNNIGEACSRLSGIPLTDEESRVLHYCVENAMIGKYTATQQISDVYFDAGDFLQMVIPAGTVSLINGQLALSVNGKTSIAILPERLTLSEDTLMKLRDAFRKAVIASYRFIFAADNPLLFVWAKLGHIYLQPAIKV